MYRMNYIQERNQNNNTVLTDGMSGGKVQYDKFDETNTTPDAVRILGGGIYKPERKKKRNIISNQNCTKYVPLPFSLERHKPGRTYYPLIHPSRIEDTDGIDMPIIPRGERIESTSSMVAPTRIKIAAATIEETVVVEGYNDNKDNNTDLRLSLLEQQQKFSFDENRINTSLRRLLSTMSDESLLVIENEDNDDDFKSYCDDAIQCEVERQEKEKKEQTQQQQQQQQMKEMKREPDEMAKTTCATSKLLGKDDDTVSTTSSGDRNRLRSFIRRRSSYRRLCRRYSIF